MKRERAVHDEEYRNILQLSAELFPNPETLLLVDSKKQQDDELKRLQAGLQHEQFFMVIDIVSVTILAASGHRQAMGWPAELTFQTYLRLYPSGGALQLMTLLGKQTFRLSHKTNNTFLEPKFIVNLPLLHASGKTLLVKRTVSPWQMTTEGYVTAYLSEFVIIKEYEGEPMHPRFVGMQPPALNEQFAQMVQQFFANLPPKTNRFSPKEMELLRLYAADEDEQYGSADVARMAGITVHTINAYNKQILRKAREMFGEYLPVKNARDVARYLHRHERYVLKWPAAPAAEMNPPATRKAPPVSPEYLVPDTRSD